MSDGNDPRGLHTKCPPYNGCILESLLSLGDRGPDPPLFRGQPVYGDGCRGRQRFDRRRRRPVCGVGRDPGGRRQARRAAGGIPGDSRLQEGEAVVVGGPPHWNRLTVREPSPFPVKPHLLQNDVRRGSDMSVAASKVFVQRSK
jgi:hypothetical protein